MATFEIDKGDILGKGQSCVFRGTYGSKAVAIKRIQLAPSLTKKEITFQKKLDHKNVLSILAVLDDLDFRYIILELCSGSLYQVITKTFKGTPLLPSDRDVLYQIADGLDYIHSQNLVHCDIKPENILVSMTGEIKLADFGSCVKTTNGTFIPSGLIGGTLQWMAPEVWPTDSNMNKVSAKADVFSFGIVCFVFLTREDGGIHPFGDWNTPHLWALVQWNIREGKQVNIEKLKHHPYANFIRIMIENNPDNRGTLTEFKKNLTVPTASSNIPSDMNISTSHQAEQEKTLVDLFPAQEQPNHGSGLKPNLKPKVVTNKGDYEEQEEHIRKISLNVSDEQETRDPPNLSTIKLNTAKFETIKNSYGCSK